MVADRSPTFDFILGALIGVYGNLLVYYIELASLPPVLDWVSSIYSTIVLLTIGIFVLYVVTSYLQVYSSNLFWIFHSLLMLLTFYMQFLFFIKKESIFISNIYYWIILNLFLGMIIITEYFGSGKYHKYLEKNRWKGKLKIGILNDLGWDLNNPETYAWTDISPENWRDHLSHFKNIEVSLITSNERFSEYAAIINPYGGVYPEKDIKQLTSLNKIISYVRNGGYFLNVADIPSYWAYSLDLKRKIDNTNPIYDPTTLQPLRPFSETPLIKTLGLSVINLDINPKQNNFNQLYTIYSKRASFFVRNMNPLIPTSFIGLTAQYEISSLFSIDFGEGAFIFSLIWINDELHHEREKIFIKKLLSAFLIKICTNRKETIS